jgi:hypothetical protein
MDHRAAVGPEFLLPEIWGRGVDLVWGRTGNVHLLTLIDSSKAGSKDNQLKLCQGPENQAHPRLAPWAGGC